jgi:hypothetical protein
MYFVQNKGVTKGLMKIAIELTPEQYETALIAIHTALFKNEVELSECELLEDIEAFKILLQTQRDRLYSVLDELKKAKIPEGKKGWIP